MVILCANGLNSEITQTVLDELIEVKTGKVLVLPFACMNDDMLKLEESYLSGFGFNNIIIYCDERKEIIFKEKYDYIVVPGGNFINLIRKINEGNILELIKNQIRTGAGFIGISNGNYIACKDIEYLSKIYCLKNDIVKYRTLELVKINLITELDFRLLQAEVECESFCSEYDVLMDNNIIIM